MPGSIRRRKASRSSYSWRLCASGVISACAARRWAAAAKVSGVISGFLEGDDEGDDMIWDRDGSLMYNDMDN